MLAAARWWQRDNAPMNQQHGAEVIAPDSVPILQSGMLFAVGAHGKPVCVAAVYAPQYSLIRYSRALLEALATRS